MEILFLEINVFAILILIILLCASRIFNSDRYLATQRVFSRLIIANILILAFDCIAVLSMAYKYPGAYTVSYICLLFCYAFGPTLSYYYTEYCDIQMGLSHEAIKKQKPLYLIPLMFAILCSIINIFYPILFSIKTPELEYQRGPLFMISFLYSLILMVFTVTRVIAQLKNSSNQKRKELLALISFVAFPVLGVVIQILVSGAPVVYFSTVLSIVIIYIMIQNSQIYHDPLTNVHNRRQLIPYLKWCMQKQDKEENKHLVMIDVDNFKMINDCFGHLVGDNVLIAIANALKSNCDKKDFIARFGGDEFVWIMMGRDEEEIKQIFIKINEQLSNTKVIESHDIKITLTYGFVEFGNEDVEPEQVISRADKKMYQLKNRHDKKNNELKDKQN